MMVLAVDVSVLASRTSPSNSEGSETASTAETTHDSTLTTTTCRMSVTGAPRGCIDWRSRTSAIRRGDAGRVHTAQGVVTVAGSAGLQALDLASGTTRWAVEEGVPDPAFTTTGGSTVVSVDGGTRLVSTDGSVRWSVGGVTPFGSASGFVVGVTAEGSVVALSPVNGRVVWTSPGPALQVFAGHSRRPVVLQPDGTIRAIATTTGADVWVRRYPGAPSVQALPDGDLIVATGRRNLVRLDRERGEVVWGIRVDATLRLDPIVLGDLLLLTAVRPGVGPSVVAVDLSDGSGRWSSDALPRWVAGTDEVVVLGTGFRVVVIERTTGTERWRSRVEQASAGAVTGGDLVIRTVDGLDARDLDTGAPRWSLELEAGPGALIDVVGEAVLAVSGADVLLVRPPEPAQRGSSS